MGRQRRNRKQNRYFAKRMGKEDLSHVDKESAKLYINQFLAAVEIIEATKCLQDTKH